MVPYFPKKIEYEAAEDDLRLSRFYVLLVMLQNCLMSVADVDECSLGYCDGNADCNNTAGGFNCSCAAGYAGNGSTCVGKCS